MLEWCWPSPFQQAPYGSRHIEWSQQASDTYVPAGTGQDEPIPSSKMWSLLLLQIWGFEIWCIFLFTGASGDSLHDWACRQIWCKLRRSLAPCGASASDNATRGRQGPCHESDDSRPRQRSKRTVTLIVRRKRFLCRSCWVGSVCCRSRLEAVVWTG
jgi:hypothetical protein